MHRLPLVLLAASLAVAVAPEARASIISYDAALSGAAELPPTPSLGTGSATVTFDTILNTMEVAISFSGLGSGTAASHIHCCTTSPGTGSAGVATAVPTFPNFPLGVTSGTYDQVFSLTAAATYNPAFITGNGGTTAGAEAALLAGVAAGEAYVNIHTANFPGGEIEGFLTPVAVPEPASIAVLGLGLASLAALRRRRGAPAERALARTA